MTDETPEVEADPGAGISRTLARVRNLLLLVSVGLALAVSPFGLDLVVGSLLGSTVVVLTQISTPVKVETSPPCNW